MLLKWNSSISTSEVIQMLFKTEIYRSCSRQDILDVEELLRAHDIEFYPHTTDAGDSIHQIVTISVRNKDKEEALYVLRRG